MATMRQVERLFPALGGILVLLLLWRYGPMKTPSFSVDLANAFFSVFSIFCGFITTSLSILFSLQGRNSMRGLKSSGAYGEVVHYHWKAVCWCFVAIAAAISFVLCKDSDFGKTPLVFYALLAIGLSAFLAFFRVIYLFVRILRLDAA